METSDSECFESADEDFYSDDETQIERKKDAKASTTPDLVKKTEKLSVTAGEERSKSPNKKEQIQNVKDDNKIEITVKGDSLEDRQLYRTECWEPGVDYEIDEDVAAPREDKQTDKQEQKNEQINIEKSAAKHQIPPAVSSSRSDLDRTLTDKVGDKTSEPAKRVHEAPPPIIAVCWEPDVDCKRQNQPQNSSPCVDSVKKKSDGDKNVEKTTSRNLTEEMQKLHQNSSPSVESLKKECNSDKNIEETSSNSNEKNKNAQKRPEFGIPPLIETCWFPNVNNVEQPFQPHPAYLELMKKKEAAENKDKTNSTTGM